jgi:predicted nucleic acid-binding protein
MKILLDTDVILDFFIDREPFCENAAQVLSLCEAKEITGFITPVILSNTYYLLRQKATHSQVIEKLKLLVSITEMLIIDKNSALLALTSSFNDFEDALQNYAAEKSNEVELIITRNIRDYKHSKLGVMEPVTFLNMWKAKVE